MEAEKDALSSWFRMVTGMNEAESTRRRRMQHQLPDTMFNPAENGIFISPKLLWN